MRPRTTTQTCVIHLIRNTFRLTSRRHWDASKKHVKLTCTAPNEAAARTALDDVTEVCGARYPAIVRWWENAWAELIPFLEDDVEIRTVICSTDASSDPTRRGQARSSMRWKTAPNASTTSPTAGQQQEPPDEDRRKHPSCDRPPSSLGVQRTRLSSGTPAISSTAKSLATGTSVLEWATMLRPMQTAISS